MNTNINHEVMLLTDCLPYEMPLIYNNKEYYKYVVDKKLCEIFNVKDLFIGKKASKFKTTQPIQFNITKNEIASRLISIPHPLAQLYILTFIKQYGELLLNYFNQISIFSGRYPYKITSYQIKDFDIIKEYIKKYLSDNEIFIMEDISHYIDSFYVKKDYKKITNFYSSKKIKRLELKYKYMLKMDYQDCFNRIYTHSIDWAYLGDKKIAKENKSKYLRFSSILDQLMQNMNYGETSGIIIGPEFSRWVAEIVLCRVDRLVYDKLKQSIYQYKTDYEIVRFVDDIFIFSNDLNSLDYIQKIYQYFCKEYKLSINEKKTYIETRPFIRKKYWLNELKEINLYYEKNISEIKNYTRYYIFNSQGQKVIDKINKLIIDYEENSASIISYFLSVFQKNQPTTLEKLKDKEDELKKYFFLQQLEILSTVLVYGINCSNILKYLRCIHWIKLNSNHNKMSLDNEIFYHLSNLLKYNKNKSSEMYNVLIYLSYMKKDLPEEVLMDILKDKHYFSICSVAYYLSINNRKYRYKKTMAHINLLITEYVNQIEEQYKDVSKLILTPEFLIVHDMYSSKILVKSTIQSIDSLKKRIKGHTFKSTTDLCFDLFKEFVSDFDKSFMNWNMKEEDIFINLINKTMSTRVSDEISS